MTPRPNILVVGAGYVGLATAVFLAENGFPTTVVEKNCEVVEALRKARLHFREPALAAALKRVIGNRTLCITQPEKTPYQHANIIFIAIDSANRKTWRMRHDSFAEMAGWIGELRRKPSPTVVLKSTNVLGFAGQFRDLLDAAPNGPSVKLLVNPEFLREGMAFEDTAHPFRIVIGAREKRDAAGLMSIYRSVYPDSMPIVQTDWDSAELIKLASNVYLAYRLAFIHEIADFARHAGLDLEPIRKGIGLDKRIGLEYFQSGLGFGGSCLPKDCMLINSDESSRSFKFASASAALAINDRLLKNLVAMIEARLGILKGKKIALLGAAFKADVDDTRDSRAVQLARSLILLQARVAVFDPFLCGRELVPETEIPLEPDLNSSLKGAHILIIGAAHTQFAQLDPQYAAGLMKHRLAFDYFGILNRARWSRAGFEVVG